MDVGLVTLFADIGIACVIAYGAKRELDGFKSVVQQTLDALVSNVKQLTENETRQDKDVAKLEARMDNIEDVVGDLVGGVKRLYRAVEARSQAEADDDDDDDEDRKEPEALIGFRAVA